MPSIFANEGDGVQTLEIDLVDEVTGVGVTLYYGVYPNQNVITRATKLINGSNGTVHLYKLASTVVDFTAGDFDMVSFYGRHCWERNFERVRLSHGTTSIGSTRGLSSHHENPFAMLCTPDTTEDNGCVYGFNFVYSGNFLFEANNDPYSETRVVMGINPKQFDFVIEAGEEFMAPEVIMSFSDAAIFMTYNPFGTTLTLILKGLAAGFAAGLVYKLLKTKHPRLAAFAASVIAPIVNTGVFLLGCYIFIWDVLIGMANEAGVGMGLLILGLAGINSMIEVVLNVVLCPTIIRIVKIASRKRLV